MGIQPGIAKQQAIADARALRALADARTAAQGSTHRGRGLD